jgi:UPF0716 protein FxsA
MKERFVGALFLLFVAVPLVELWLLLKAGGTFGVGVTIGIVLLTGALGASLARREGLRALTRMTEAANKGMLPTQAMFDGMAIFLGGALLLTPGFLTDAVGFALLFPLSREFLRFQFASWIKTRIDSGQIMVHHNTMNSQGPTPFDPRPPSSDSRIYDQTLDE